MSKLKTPIILLIIILLLYFASLGVKFSDKDTSIDGWVKTFERYVNKPPVTAGELSLVGSSDAGCRFSVNNADVPIIIISGTRTCSVAIEISKKDKNVRSLVLNSPNNVKFKFVGRKGPDDQPASAPFSGKTLADLSNSLDVMMGGGVLSITCLTQRQCKVSLG